MNRQQISLFLAGVAFATAGFCAAMDQALLAAINTALFAFNLWHGLRSVP